MNTYPYEEGTDLIIRYMPQECSGNYGEWDKDWMRTMKRKIQYIIDYLYEIKDGELMVHADIDIAFYRSFRNDLKQLMSQSGNDIMFQNDGPTLCMGFFVVKKSKTTVELFNKVCEKMGGYAHDQEAMNALVGVSSVKYDRLPPRYYSFGALNGHRRWDPSCKHIIVPKDIIMHHANWTVGIDNKLELIRRVKHVVDNS